MRSTQSARLGCRFWRSKNIALHCKESTIPIAAALIGFSIRAYGGATSGIAPMRYYFQFHRYDLLLEQLSIRSRVQELLSGLLSCIVG